jgi:RHS repeat-associated protein
MQYTKGRLSEAYTVAHGAGCAAAKITDEGFSYNKRGDLADFYESTPHSGGYYHTTADYFPNGKLKSLSGVPGQSAIAYGVDSMGRACSALKGSTPPAPCPATPGSTSLVNSVAYNPAGQVTDINLGLGDKDDYVYDGSTGHMTQYQFTVGSTPKTLTGTLYWNPNGTLNKHDIVDNLSMQTQSCDTISYDDLGRLSAYNCGSAWGQNFTYDRYGNITKTGSISWGCTSCYTASTNHYNGSLSPLIQYDANGNLLNDSYATYTWNAFGRPATIVSSSNNLTLTYDAFGRLVEKQNGSTYNEILYGASGNLGLMSGQNTYSVDFPLPGGVSYRTWSGGGFLHRDWLGSGRMDTLISSRTVYSATAYAPFGENYAQSGVNDNFTGDLDYLLQYDKDPSGGGGFADTRARELRAKQGRWISPDPAGLGAVDLANPQTWNRYAYVTNNPLSFVDPTGLGPCSDEQNPAICNGTGYSFALSVLLGFGTWDSFDILNFAFSGAEQVAVPTGGSIPLITDGDSLQVALLPDTADAEAQEVGIHWVYPNIGALSLLSWPHFKGQTPYLPNDPGANKPTQTPRQQCVAQAQQTFNNTMDQINSQSILPSVTEGAAFGTLAGAAWGCFVGYPAFPLPELAQVACEETYGASALIPAINGGISGGGAAATKWFLRQSALMSNAQNTFTQQVQNVCSKLPG